MSGNPKEQHFLPKMLLKGFCDENEQIFMFDGKTNKVSAPRNIDSVAREKHLYTIFSSAEKNYEVEKIFSEIEDKVAPVFKKINIFGFEILSETETFSVMDFIVLTFLRTPLQTQTAEEVLRDTEVQSELKNISPEGAPKYIDECLANRGTFFAHSIGESFKNRGEILSRNFDVILFTAEDGAPPFMLNDTFMCMQALSHKIDIHYIGREVDWSKMNIAKHFPVSNKHCISFFPKVDLARIGTPTIAINYAQIASAEIKRINAISFKQKRRYAYCSDKTVLEETP